MVSDSNEENQIRKLIADWTSALCVKDLHRMMANYADNVVFFDVKPPFQMKGVAALQQTWEQCLPYFPESFQIETRDMIIHAHDTVAFAHWLWRFTGMEQDHPAAQTWMRATVGYQKRGDQWLIVHEHVSLPFNPETSQVVYAKDL